MPTRSRRPSAALVIAVLALVVAVGGNGWGYAAKKLDGDTIARKSIPGNRLEPNSVGTKQVNESLLATVPDAANAGRLAGLDKSQFLSNQARVAVATATPVTGLDNGVQSQISVSCQPTEKAIGGGGGWIIPTDEQPSGLKLPVTFSGPVLDGEGQVTGWLVFGRNMEAGVSRLLRVYAICVPRTP